MIALIFLLMRSVVRSVWATQERMIRIDTQIPLLVRSPTQQIQQDHQDDLAKRIEVHNYLYQIRIGDKWRCMWCMKESPVYWWPDFNTCPYCHRKYDPIQVYDMEE